MIVAATGILLALKKDFDALQPPVAQSSAPGLSDLRIRQLIDNLPAGGGTDPVSWRDVDRIDIEPADGIAKIILSSRQEYQVDLHTGEVLQAGYRTSDLLETIHDFSFLGSFGKYVFSVPTGIALLVMWLTGTYMFLLPFWIRRKKRRRP